MLIMSALLSQVIFPSAQSFSKSVFNRLTSVLTEVLSMLAIKMTMKYLEYSYHIIAFFDLLEAPWTGENRFFDIQKVRQRISADSVFTMS